MTIQSEAFRADLHELMTSPVIGLCKYEADPAIQRRLGRMLVDAAKINALAASKASPKVMASNPDPAVIVSDTKPALKLVPKGRW